TWTVPWDEPSAKGKTGTNAPTAGAQEHSARAGGAAWSGARRFAAGRRRSAGPVERRQSIRGGGSLGPPASFEGTSDWRGVLSHAKGRWRRPWARQTCAGAREGRLRVTTEVVGPI